MGWQREETWGVSELSLATLFEKAATFPGFIRVTGYSVGCQFCKSHHVLLGTQAGRRGQGCFSLALGDGVDTALFRSGFHESPATRLQARHFFSTRFPHL